MIDDKKIIGMLQAKSLGCLDDADSEELQNFINAGYVFPWKELGVYQNTAAVLPLTLQLEIPDAGLKDKVALKLIKLSEEIKAKKALEEEQQKVNEIQERIEEDIEVPVEEYQSLDEPFVEPPIEIETEQTAEVTDIKFSDPPQIDELSFNLDDIQLTDIEPENLPQTTEITSEFDNSFTSDIIDEVKSDVILDKVSIDEVSVDDVNLQNITFDNETIVDSRMGLEEIDEVLIDNKWIEPEEPKITITNEPEVRINKTTIETNLVEEAEDTSKPDLTKRSVAEKMFKAIEQDFDMLKYHTEESEKKVKRGLMIAYLIIAFLAALLVVLFFKFNSDIENQQKEIDYLKKRPTAFLNFIVKDFYSNRVS